MPKLAAHPARLVRPPAARPGHEAMDAVTVLVTAVGSTNGTAVMNALRHQDEFRVRIIGTDCNAAQTIAGSAFCDTFYQVPPAVDPEYLPTMQELCRREAVGVLIPIVDSEVLAIAARRELFEELGITVAASSGRVVATCNDKYATWQWFRERGVPTAKTWLADDVPDLGALEYPVFVKPRFGRGSIGAARADSPAELAALRRRTPGLVVQELLSGDEYTIDVLADFDGRVFSVVPRRRLEVKAGISYKGASCHHDLLTGWATTIAERLGIRGPANIQCLVAGSDVRFIEVNPRFSGGYPLTVASGVNGPHWLLKLRVGQRPGPALLPYRDTLMARYWGETFRPAA